MFCRSDLNGQKISIFVMQLVVNLCKGYFSMMGILNEEEVLKKERIDETTHNILCTSFGYKTPVDNPSCTNFRIRFQPRMCMHPVRGSSYRIVHGQA